MLAASACQAGIVWNELLEGDLSGDRFAPTSLLVAAGSNELLGVMAGATGGPGGTIDRDYFTITIPSGHVLSSIVLGVYISPDFSAFLGIQPGTVFPDDPDAVIPSDLLGWTHFGPIEEGTDLLPMMGMNGQGFSPPLPPGVYSFWAQQTDDYTDYALNFVVEEVPTPGSVAVVWYAAAFIARRRKKR